METLRYVLLSTLLTPGYLWVTRSSHTNVIPNLTDDVALHCFCDNPFDTNPAIEQITRIRLLKMNDTKAWNMYAEIVVPNNTKAELAEPNVPGISASGHLSDLNESFLSVTWATASDETAGVYTCEVDGFAVHQGTNTQINTAVLNITNNPATVSDLLTVAIQMKQKASNLSQMLENMKADSSLQHRQITEKMRQEINGSVESNYFETRYWPSGNYALLSAETGCPDTPFRQLRSGSGTVQSESMKTDKHEFSSPHHLGKVFERCGTRNILKLRFCSNDKTEPRILWPQGSYCIHYSSGCTTNFVYGFTTLHSESSRNLELAAVNMTNPLTHDSAKRYWHMLFCCREDGLPSIPIVLPTEKPFYLYRYKGECQRVFNMDVRNEWVDFHTNPSKTNTFNNVHHADGDILKARVEMCYYTKRRRPN